jgi:hypothetical protein
MERRVDSLLSRLAMTDIGREAVRGSQTEEIWTYHSERLHLDRSAIADLSCRGILTVLGLGLGNAIVGDIACFFFQLI